MNYQDLYDKALRIAIKSHEGQKDKSGREYIMHPIRVAERCSDPRAKIVALLHDTIEDTEVTVDYLREQGFPEEIINGIRSVTKRDGESYEDFVRRAAENEIGIIVKKADLEDNMDIRRLQEITDKDVERLRKYLKAWKFLNGTALSHATPTAPIEAERKFLVEIVGELPECRELEITQTYLMEKDGLEPRVRRREEAGQYVYFLTTKRFVSVNERVEIEKEITKEEYDTLLAEANPAKSPIHKRRQCFEWNGRYLELDTFVEPPRPHHLLEIEHVSMDDAIVFPPFLKVLKEVTEDPEWYNANIAKVTP